MKSMLQRTVMPIVLPQKELHLVGRAIAFVTRKSAVLILFVTAHATHTLTNLRMVKRTAPVIFPRETCIIRTALPSKPPDRYLITLYGRNTQRIL